MSEKTQDCSADQMSPEMTSRELLNELLKAELRQSGFLDEACGADQGMRREVESLLKASGRGDSLMERPAAAHLGLAGTRLARAQCQTIRLKLLKIGALVRVTVRKVWVKLSSGSPYAAVFRRVHENLSRLRPMMLRC